MRCSQQQEILDQDDLEELEEKSVKGSSTAIEYDDGDDPEIIPARELLNDYNRLLNQTHLDVGSQTLVVHGTGIKKETI